MNDAFFDALKERINSEGLTERARSERAERVAQENVGFAQEAIADMQKILAETDGKLQSLGIQSHLRSGADQVTLALRWADMEHVEVQYQKAKTSSQVVATISDSTQRHGYFGEPVRVLNRRDWDPELETANIRDLVERFVDVAKEQGGL